MTHRDIRLNVEVVKHLYDMYLNQLDIEYPMPLQGKKEVLKNFKNRHAKWAKYRLEAGRIMVFLHWLRKTGRDHYANLIRDGVVDWPPPNLAPGDQ